MVCRIYDASLWPEEKESQTKSGILRLADVQSMYQKKGAQGGIAGIAGFNGVFLCAFGMS